MRCDFHTRDLTLEHSSALSPFAAIIFLPQVEDLVRLSLVCRTLLDKSVFEEDVDGLGMWGGVEDGDHEDT
ncbi:MAG TPA: hypothetical protein VGO47_07505 [Chlamydiales bacterium]|jgi:hypothetical protein|nr:hypothetical protein [Chlamydiales bacterium]